MKASAFAIAFTDGNGHPTKMLNISFLPSLAQAKEKLKFYVRKAQAEHKDTFGKTWGYKAVELKPVR